MHTILMILVDNFKGVSFTETIQKIIRPNSQVIKYSLPFPKWLDRILVDHQQNKSFIKTLTKG